MKVLTGEYMSLRDIFTIIKNNEKLKVSDKLKERINKNRRKLSAKIEEGNIIYGVNTGLGELKDKVISVSDSRVLQENIIKSHSIGVGEPASPDVAKLTILFRALSFIHGYSGIRSILLDKLIELYNTDIYPFIPSEGSVGASGDLAPLAHLGLFLIGKGKVIRNNQIMNFEYQDFKPIKLQEKEGLALVNGTSYSLALLTFNYFKFLKILDNLLFGLSLAFDGLRGNIDSLHPFIHGLKKYKGQKYIADKLRNLLKGSDFVISSKKGSDQDSYTLRCIPQVLGPLIDTMQFVKYVIESEINSVSDNPVFDENGVDYNGGNFHAMYIAISSDYLKICGGIIANLVERLIFKFTDRNLSKGLPPFLTLNPGMNSGLMLLQYTAASLVAEIRTLATPSSIHNIPTSANQEDIVSMSIPSLITLKKIIEDLEILTTLLIFTSIISIEIRKSKHEGNMVGSRELQLFYEKYKEMIKIEIMYADVIYYEDIYSLSKVIFPSSLYELNYKNIMDLL